MAKSAKDDGDHIVSTSQVCRWIGVNRSTLTNWRRQFDFPEPVATGSYDIREIFKWFNIQRKQLRRGIDMTKDEADTRLAITKEERQRLALMMERGDVIDRDQAVRNVIRGVTIANSTLDEHVAQMLQHISPEVVGEKKYVAIRRALIRETNRTRRALARCEMVEDAEAKKRRKYVEELEALDRKEGGDDDE